MMVKNLAPLADQSISASLRTAARRAAAQAIMTVDVVGRAFLRKLSGGHSITLDESVL
jgi:hypothetical protein